MKLTCALALITAIAAFAGNGTTGFTFLQVPTGARAVAMGGAFSAVPGDPLSLYWNPAASALPEQRPFHQLHQLHDGYAGRVHRMG